MILKGSQRSGGADLAAHLLRTDDNEHVRVHEMRGFASDDLRGAFKEAEAISRGTKCRQYLFSLSLSPPEQERVSVAAFEGAINRIEDRLGLAGQPRAIVFHEKEGRRHAHCVWSRIDADTMTARPVPFFKNKLMEVSRGLYLEHGWRMPSGIAVKGERNPTNFTLAEWQQAKRQGVDPRWTKEAVQACWKQSDSRAAFERALKDRGFALARGDRRGFVVVDHMGEVHSLPRVLDVKTKEVRARLGEGDDLRGVADVQKEIGAKLGAAMKRHIAESRERFAKRASMLGQVKEEMTRAHREARRELDNRLDTEWQDAARDRSARLPKGVRGLWHRITGKYQEMRDALRVEAQRQAASQAETRQALIDAQLGERRTLQTEIKALRNGQADQLRSLRADVGRYVKFAESRERSEGRDASRSRSEGLGLSLKR